MRSKSIKNFGTMFLLKKPVRDDELIVVESKLNDDSSMDIYISYKQKMFILTGKELVEIAKEHGLCEQDEVQDEK